MFSAVFLSAILSFGATPAADTEVHAQLVKIASRLDRLREVDLGNCEYRFAAFHDGYHALIDSPSAQAMSRVLDYYHIEEHAPARVDHNPSQKRCMRTLESARTILQEYGAYLDRLAEGLRAFTGNADRLTDQDSK